MLASISDYYTFHKFKPKGFKPGAVGIYNGDLVISTLRGDEFTPFLMPLLFSFRQDRPFRGFTVSSDGGNG